MKRTLDEHANRFDGMAAEYDDLERPVYAACRDMVISEAAPQADEVVLDIGAGTGAIALALADQAKYVEARDISEAMLAEATEKAEANGITNITFDTGRFRAPNVDRDIDIVTSNYAMHHLDDDGKREAIGVIAQLSPRRFVLGDLMLFDQFEDPAYDTSVDDPATVGMLTTALTDCGFVIRNVEPITNQAGVIVAERS